MLLYPTPEFRKRRGRAKPAAEVAPPPVALTLVAAEYSDAEWVRLTFDRPIDIAGLVGGAIVIDDGYTGWRYTATGAATLLGPTQVEIVVEYDEQWAGPDVRLIASAGSGIVAVDDGGTWAGYNVEVPFP